MKRKLVAFTAEVLIGVPVGIAVLTVLQYLL
jgi:hypothetical protein